jgi:hypothetical protein
MCLVRVIYVLFPNKSFGKPGGDPLIIWKKSLYLPDDVIDAARRGNLSGQVEHFLHFRLRRAELEALVVMPLETLFAARSDRHPDRYHFPGFVIQTHTCRSFRIMSKRILSV